MNRNKNRNKYENRHKSRWQTKTEKKRKSTEKRQRNWDVNYPCHASPRPPRTLFLSIFTSRRKKERIINKCTVKINRMLCDAFVAPLYQRHQRKTQIIHHRNGILSIVKIPPIESIFPMQSNLQFKNKAQNYKFIAAVENEKRRSSNRWQQQQQHQRWMVDESKRKTTTTIVNSNKRINKIQCK